MLGRLRKLTALSDHVEMARFLYRQRTTGFDQPTEPHFDPETTAFFREKLAQSRLYLEYGSGGSTVLADTLGVPTISIEGDRYYAKAVRSALSQGTSVNIITPRIGLTREWSMPVVKTRAKARRYVTAPFAVIDGTFPDLVLVDGRYRVACALETARRAIAQAAATSILIDDYDQRSSYQVVASYLGAPKRIGRSALFEITPGRVPMDSVPGKLMRDPR